MEQPPIIRISSAATKSGHKTVAMIDRNLVERKASDAKRSDRRREIHNFHEGDSDPLQRMLNAVQPGSYIRPHRHLNPPKSESIILLQGQLAYVSFSHDGLPEEGGLVLIDVSRGVYGCDFRPGVWHTIFALTPNTVLFEVKPGPYDPSADKEFAPWSPPEHTPEAVAFLAELEDGFRRLWGLSPRSWELPPQANAGGACPPNLSKP